MKQPDSARFVSCGLCGAEGRWLCADRLREYFGCPDCGLVFADPASHLSREAERAEYDQHENDPADSRYRRFLARLAEPLLARLEPGMRGLDYGCGPGPTLGVMLAERGMEMHEYDPIYAPHGVLLRRRYDFVTATEVVEHFRRPGEAWRQLASLVRPGGWLGIMTLLAPNGGGGFPGWWYKNDPTHVSFYTAATFDWLAGELGCELEILDERVVLMRRR